MTYTMMIKPASGLCNLRCRYCFYADECNQREEYSFGMMRPADATRLVTHVLDQLTDSDSITFAFQGGEPTLAGLDYFRAFIDAVHAHSFTGTVSYALQTNGIVIDEVWAEFLHENKFLVGLSLDGEAKFHDTNRVGIDGKGSFARVLQTKKLLEQYDVDYNILTVLTENAARYPQQFWKFIVRHNIQYIQFVPCLDSLSDDESYPSALSPERFASFYTALFPLWAQALRNGQYISIKFFDDLFNLMLKRQCTACGFTGQCTIQLIVEADGGVYPCDFYVLDEWKLGNIYEDTMESLQSCDKSKAFLSRGRTESALCDTCTYRRICNGGCPRMERSMYLNKEKTFCGYQTFLKQCSAEINRMAQYLSAWNG